MRTKILCDVPKSERQARTCRQSFMSTKAAKVFDICRLTIARLSRAACEPEMKSYKSQRERFKSSLLDECESFTSVDIQSDGKLVPSLLKFSFHLKREDRAHRSL